MYQPLRNFGRLSKEARGDCSLKEFTDTALKLRHNVLSKVGNPLVMALHECEILIFVGLEVFEFGILPACLVVLEVLGDVIIEEGLEECLERRPTTRIYERKTDGDIEAKLVTLCCSEPPKGFAKWSFRLLADKMVELNYVESISHVTVRSVLKKTNLSLGK